MSYTTKDMLRDLDKRSSKPRRATDKDREALTEHLREAFAAGCMKQDELDRRITKAVAAVTLADLAELAEDLPSNIELKGKEKLGPVRKWLVGISKDDLDEHQWLWAAAIVLGLLVAVVPTVAIGVSGWYSSIIGGSLMAISLVVGVCGFIGGLVLLINSTI